LFDSGCGPYARKERQALDLSQGEIMEFNVELLAQRFWLGTPQGEAPVGRFPEQSFQKYPPVTPLFTHITIKAQKNTLLPTPPRIIKTWAARTVTNPHMKLGVRHAGYGTQPVQDGVVAEAPPDSHGSHGRVHMSCQCQSHLDRGIQHHHTAHAGGHPRGGSASRVKTRKSEQSTLRQAQGPELRRGAHHEGGSYGRSNA